MSKDNSSTDKRKRSPSKSLEEQLAEIEAKMDGTKKTLAKQEEKAKAVRTRIADKKKAEEAKKTQETAKEISKIISDTGLSMEELAALAREHAKNE